MINFFLLRSKKNIAMRTLTIKIGIISLIVGLCSSCHQRTVPEQDTVRKVKLAIVEKAVGNDVNEFSGVIKEAEEVNMGFRVAGSIKKILVKEGDFVKKNQVVAELDSRDYLVQLNAVQTQYDQVKAETDRVKELYARNSVSANDYDKAVAGEKMCREKLKNAQDQYNDTKLKAPFDGYIQTIKYKQGELVGQGMTVVTAINVDFYSVEIDVPSAIFIRKDDFTGFECYQTLLSEKPFPLELIGNDIKASNNQLYRLYFRLDPKADNRLAPGMDVKVKIITKGAAENPTMIPIKAIFKEDNDSFVWTYSASDSTVVKKKITTTGKIANGKIQVATGLNGGEQIVVAGVHVIKENQKVVPMQEVSETNVGGLL